jgi:Uma2 family endonuclease
MTIADYRKLPPDDWRYQLIDGEIVMAPAPSFFHQRILSALEDEELGQVLCAPLDLFLDDNNVYQPDVHFISREREWIIQDDGLHGAPDLVVEVLSPRTARYDLNPKRAGYARAGVRELWFVYPEAKRVDLLYLEKNPDASADSYSLGQTFSSPLCPELEISIDKIFAR